MQCCPQTLSQKLKLTLSAEKTLITHAMDEKANFLGYEITGTRDQNLISDDGRRATNGVMALLMPQKVVRELRSEYSERGKITHRSDALLDTDYTIIQRYQSVLRGIYNYYCMAINVGQRSRMNYVKWMLETSLARTLASKHKCSVSGIFRKYQRIVNDQKVLCVVVERPDKNPLVAIFGGIEFSRKPDGLGIVNTDLEKSWYRHATHRSEVVQRLIAGKCELCGAKGPVQMHHIRKLADLDRPGRRPKAEWQKIMAARRRKTLAVCEDCHVKIHNGRYDGPSPG